MPLARKLRKDAGILGLLYASLGAIVGSGWLFGPFHAARMAGPYSLGSWFIGALAVLLLALVYSELGTLIPRSGAIVHMSSITHGAALSLVWSWILFFTYVAVGPVEVMAALTYAENYMPGLIEGTSGLLTPLGLVVSVVLLGVFVALNFLAIRWVLFVNSAATWWKLVVPGATVLVLISLSYHPENLHVVAAQRTSDIDGMFTAVATAGVIFSYLGFRQAIDLAGETANPGRNIPIAVIGSVGIAFLLYGALQFAFLLAVSPAELAKTGWAGQTFAEVTGPFAALAVAGGATWWAVVLYIDAIISPAGTAFIYVTTASRITMAMAEIGRAPPALARISARGVPWVALIVTYAVGALFFFPFPSWQKLVSYISSVTVLSYGIGPIVLLQLRRAMPDAPRPFRLKAARVLASVAFIVSNLIVCWTGLATLNFLFGLLCAVFALYLAYHRLARTGRGWRSLEWTHAWWLLPYFAGLWLLTFLGPADIGGNEALTLYEDMAAIAVFSLVIMWLALATALPHELTRQMVRAMTAEASSSG